MMLDTDSSHDQVRGLDTFCNVWISLFADDPLLFILNSLSAIIWGYFVL